jgi:hypothetical protein
MACRGTALLYYQANEITTGFPVLCAVKVVSWVHLLLTAFHVVGQQWESFPLWLIMAINIVVTDGGIIVLLLIPTALQSSDLNTNRY